MQGKESEEELQASWGDKPCHGDVWHIFDQGATLCRNLAKKAQGATTQREKREKKMEAAKLKEKGNKLSAKLTQAHKNEAMLQKLASEIKNSRLRNYFFLRKHKNC